MTATKKTKLCWNCEGVVDRGAENCIYCGVYLHPEEEDLDEEFEQEAPSSPYQPSEAHEDKGEEPKPLYQNNDVEHTLEELESEQVFKGSEDIRGVILPLIFLLAGSVFLLFSFILYFFSKDGVFTLKWNANYWFVYLFFSIPLLYIGWRTLQYFEERGT